MEQPTPSVRIGIIGTGFGVSSQLPGFRQVPGAEVVAICSGRRERAEQAAREHGIELAYDDYQIMLHEAKLDLVSIVTPVVTHAPMSFAAVEAGCHVLCEKPTAMDAIEARAMYDRAKMAGGVHMIDHELRFDPTRTRIAELIAEGYVGTVYFAAIRNVGNFRLPGRPWSWWSQRAQGGGALGASGSHQVDLLRWWLGDIVEVNGQLETFVTSRPDPASGGEPRTVDSDDTCIFSARFASGAQAYVTISYLAHHGGSNGVEIHGSEGSLVLDNDDRLWGRRAGADSPEELTPAPSELAAGVPANVWARSFALLARELVGAIQDERALRRGATFYDGWRVQQVLDAIRRSSEQGCRVPVEES